MASVYTVLPRFFGTLMDQFLWPPRPGFYGISAEQSALYRPGTPVT
jgi:hypothetical protein